MSLGIGVRGLAELTNGVARMETRLHTGRSVAMERAVRLVERDLKSKGLRGNKGRHPFWGVTGAAGDALGVRTGSTIRSVTARVFVRGRDVVGVVGSPQKSLQLHEEGGTVQGRQYLRVPTAAAQTGAGQDRYAGMSIRDIPGAFLVRTKAGRLWAAQPQGGPRSGRITFLYLLTRSVRLRARHVFRATRARTEAAVAGEFRRMVSDTVSVSLIGARVA